MSLQPEEITSIIRERISNFESRLKVDEVGTVLTVGDGVARVFGLKMRWQVSFRIWTRVQRNGAQS